MCELTAPSPALNKWICVQFGAREHYAVPRMLHRAGRLAALLTDLWCPACIRHFCRVTPLRAARSFGGRFHAGLTDAPVVSFNWASFLRPLEMKAASRDGCPGFYHHALAESKWFAGKVAAGLRARSWPGCTVVFSYNGTAVEPFRWAKAHELACVLGQMDLGRAEHDLMRAEAARWPGWEPEGDRDVPPERFERRDEEWALADRIVVNSKWAYDSLVRQHVPPNKIVIVPLCYEAEAVSTRRRNEETPSVVRALWLGQVNIRKGIQYLIGATRQLERLPLAIDVVGAIRVTPAALAGAPENMRFHGQVSRSSAGKHYAAADFFVLPTISDGFAITQLEAMAHGLPVIATPNCGEVVTHGVDGLIVPAADSKALGEAIMTLATDHRLRASMSEKAKEKARQYSLQAVSERLLRELGEL